MDKIKWEEILKHKNMNYDWEIFKNTLWNVKASHNFMVMKDYFNKITTLVLKWDVKMALETFFFPNYNMQKKEKHSEETKNSGMSAPQSTSIL